MEGAFLPNSKNTFPISVLYLVCVAKTFYHNEKGHSRDGEAQHLFSLLLACYNEKNGKQGGRIMPNYGKYYIGIRLLLLKEYLQANAGKDRIVKRREIEVARSTQKSAR